MHHESGGGIRANTSPSTVGSVRFAYDGNANYRTENAAPYAMAGDVSGDYFAWTPGAGAHSVTARAYSGSNAGGTAGGAVTLAFTVTDTAKSLSSEDVSDLAPGGTEMIDPDAAAVGDGGGDSRCGALGVEGLVLMALLGLRRRRRTSG